MSPGFAAVLVVHCCATWFMVGLIWFVQVVHYPLLARSTPEETRAQALEHQRRTTLVVAPVMLVELVTGIALCVPGVQPGGWDRAMVAWIGLGLLALVWLSTFGVQVPLHSRLALGGDVAVVGRLVASNWVRTALWSARGCVALALVLAAFRLP